MAQGASSQAAASMPSPQPVELGVLLNTLWQVFPVFAESATRANKTCCELENALPQMQTRQIRGNSDFYKTGSWQTIKDDEI